MRCVVNSLLLMLMWIFLLGPTHIYAENVTSMGNPFMTVSPNLSDTGYFPRQGPGTGSTINANGITDGNNGTFNTTWTGDANPSWPYDGIGLQFPEGMEGVHRFEWDMQTFGDGGWYNTLDVPIRVQVTTDPAFANYPIITGTNNGADGIWTSVPSHNNYPLYVSAAVPTEPGVPAFGTTFVFEIDYPGTIYGIRIIGDGGGVAGSDGTGFVGAQEIRVFTGDGTGRAKPVWPPQDAEGVTVSGLELVWIPVADPNAVGHLVYIGTDPNGLLASGTEPLPFETTSFLPAIAKDTVYFWRVDEIRDDGEIITGYTAIFKTELSLPIINVQPADVTAGTGRKAVFSVSATEPSGAPMTYQWFYDADGVPGGEVMITDGPNHKGALTDRLMLLDVSSADEGYYFCVVDNGNAVPTRMARLVEGHLIAHWPLDDDPNDIVNGYGGTAHGEPVYEPGVIGGAMRFDGINDYVELPPGFADFSWGLTLSVWAKPKTNGAWARFVDFANGSPSDNILFARGDTTDSFVLEIYDGGAGGGVWSPAVLELNVWQMLTATVDRYGNVVLYKNGERVGVGTTRRPNVVPRGSNYIGRSNWFHDLPYAGSMDDLRLYDYPLTAQEVADLYLLAPGTEHVCIAQPQFDLNGDCTVDLKDLAIIAGVWLECGRYPSCLDEIPE